MTPTSIKRNIAKKFKDNLKVKVIEKQTAIDIDKECTGMKNELAKLLNCDADCVVFQGAKGKWYSALRTGIDAPIVFPVCLRFGPWTVAGINAVLALADDFIPTTKRKPGRPPRMTGTEPGEAETT